MVANKWRRGHSVRGVDGYKGTGPALLPSPDDDFELGDIDLGELEPDPEPEPVGPPPPVDLGDLPPDPEPSWIGDKAKPKRGRAAGSKSTKPTAAVARDVRGQLALLIGTFGSMLAMLDPICGGVAVEQTVPMADAWTDVVLESPKAVEFFTGPAGMAMLLFRAGVASIPLVATAWNHHVAHSIGREQAEPVNREAYAA